MYAGTRQQQNVSSVEIFGEVRKDELKGVEGSFACVEQEGGTTFGSRLITSNPTGKEYEDKVLLTVALTTVSQRITSRRSSGRERLEFVPPSCRVQMNKIDNDR